MAPKPAKKETDVPVFDLKKPDLGPLDRKFQAGDDEQNLSEAFAMMLFVPHIDGYRDKLTFSGALDKAVACCTSHPSTKVRLNAFKAAAYYVTWEKEISRHFRKDEFAIASVRLLKECMDAYQEFKETGGANAPVDPKAKKGAGPVVPYEATAEGAECALRAVQVYLLVMPGVTRGELLKDRNLEDVLDVATKFEDPTLILRQRAIQLLYPLCGFPEVVNRLLAYNLLPFLWAQASSDAQGTDARVTALQCLQLVITTAPHMAVQLYSMLQPPADAPPTAPRGLLSQLLEVLVVRDPIPPIPPPVKGAPVETKPPEAPRDPEKEVLKGAVAALLSAVVQRVPDACRELLHVGGDRVLRAILPQPPATSAAPPPDPRPSSVSGQAGRPSMPMSGLESRPSVPPTEPELPGFRAQDRLILPPDRPVTSFVAHAAALESLAVALQLPDLRTGFLTEEAYFISSLEWQTATAAPAPQASTPAAAAAAAHAVPPVPGQNNLPPVPKKPILEHLLFLLSPQADGTTQPVSVQLGAAQLLHSLVLDHEAARRLLHLKGFLELCQQHLVALASSHTMLGTYLLSTLALVCHQADRRHIEEKGYGDIVIEVAKAVGAGAPSVLRHALGQCVMVINPEYPLRPSSLAAFDAPHPPSFPVPPLWDILADVSLQER